MCPIGWVKLIKTLQEPRSLFFCTGNRYPVRSFRFVEAVGTHTEAVNLSTPGCLSSSAMGGPFDLFFLSCGMFIPVFGKKVVCTDENVGYMGESCFEALECLVDTSLVCCCDKIERMMLKVLRVKVISGPICVKGNYKINGRLSC